MAAAAAAAAATMQSYTGDEYTDKEMKDEIEKMDHRVQWFMIQEYEINRADAAQISKCGFKKLMMWRQLGDSGPRSWRRPRR